jgi:histidinol-phosphate/aromatic aminotransferase/cobyric acid decarboxylase-like protein
MTVWSFTPTQISNALIETPIKNKGNFQDLVECRKVWVNWISKFSGAENKSEWAITNGIHDAIVHQLAHVRHKFNKIYWFDSDYGFYKVICMEYNSVGISSNRLDLIEPNSYVIVSQPNHEGGITPWFKDLISLCENNGSKIFLDCAFYGCTLDNLDTSLEVFDAVAFSMSKNFLLGGIRSGIVFSDSLPMSLTVPISKYFTYNYFNTFATEAAKNILPKFDCNYITRHAKPIQKAYCEDNNLIPADIWMWAFDANGNKVLLTDEIKHLVQQELDNESV